MEQIDCRLQDDFRRCMDYLDTNVDDLIVPDRSPARPRQIPLPLKSHDLRFSDHDMLDSSLAEYVLQDDPSLSPRDSIFSHEVLRSPEDLDAFLDDVSSADEICTVDNVVTIRKVHDQWDPKKVGFVLL